LEQPEDDANLGQKKPSPAVEREISGSLTRRADVGRFFRIRLQRLPTSLDHVIPYLLATSWEKITLYGSHQLTTQKPVKKYFLAS
jgi:hypothetical protein